MTRHRTSLGAGHRGGGPAGAARTVGRAALVALAAAVGAACSDDDGGVTTPDVPPLAFVRYVNAVPDTNNLTLRFIDQVAFSPDTWVNVPFQEVGQGNYQGTEAGDRAFRVFTFDPSFSVAGNTAMLVDTTLTFAAGRYYTLLHVGFARPGASPRQRIVLLEDPVPSAAPPGIAVRAVHAGAGVGAVDVYVAEAEADSADGAPAFGALTIGTATAYAALPPGPVVALVTPAGARHVLLAGAAPAGVGGTATADPLAGATVPGSVLTAFAFPASVSGSRAAERSAGVRFVADRQPDRAVSP